MNADKYLDEDYYTPYDKIIFLDIDGVLNNKRYRKIQYDEWGNFIKYERAEFLDPECIRNLNTIVAQSGAKVVISSTWRKTYEIEVLTDMLQEAGFVGEIIDYTPIKLL